TDFVKDDLPAEQRQKRDARSDSLRGERRLHLIGLRQRQVAKNNSANPTDFQIGGIKLNFELGLFLNLVHQKTTKLTDAHQMVESQDGNGKEKNQCGTEQTNELKNFSHAETDTWKVKPPASQAAACRSVDEFRLMLEELFRRRKR